MTDAPEAMQTVFDDGTGAPTRVIIARDIALADLGLAAIEADAFARWIDTEGARIYESARRLRQTAHGYEEVTLRQPSELIEPLPRDVPTLEEVSTDPAEQARVVPLGDGLAIGSDDAPDGAEPLFVGSFEAALDDVLRHDAQWRAGVCIWTPGRIYGPADFDRLLAARLGRPR